MKVNLQKKLEKSTENRIEAPEKYEGIENIKLLLENTAVEEQDLLKSFKLDDNLRHLEQIRSDSIEIEKFREEYGNVYMVEDIKKLAIKYRLRFLKLEAYKGAIDPLLATKMLAFGKQHNVEIKNLSGFDHLKVLASAEDFSITTKEIVRPTISLDPLLFYKLDRDGKFWTLIHKWGKTFTYIRWLTSLPFRNKKLMFWFVSIPTICFFAFLTKNIALWCGTFENNYPGFHPIWFSFVWSLLTFGLSALFVTAVIPNIGYEFWWWKSERTNNDAFYSEDAWNKNHKNVYV